MSPILAEITRYAHNIFGLPLKTVAITGGTIAGFIAPFYSLKVKRKVVVMVVVIHNFIESWYEYLYAWLSYMTAGNFAATSVLSLLLLWAMFGLLWWCCVGMSTRAI